MIWRALCVATIARALQRNPAPRPRTAAARHTAAAPRAAAKTSDDAAAPRAAAKTSGDYGSLQREMERGGASFTDCRIAPCGGTERAVVATAAHAAGSVLIRVPRALAITPDAALAYASGAAAEALEDTAESDLLALWLLEQDASSEFVRSLPAVEDLAHLPVFWAAGDLELLAHSDVGRALKRRVARDDAFDAALRRASPHYAALCDRERWAWAKALVSSRAFSVPGDDGPLPPGSCVGEQDEGSNDDGVSCLMPLVDMINHVAVSDGGSCEWGVERLPGDVRGDFVIRALRDIEPGEVSISYGALSAAGSLLNYGFLGRDAASDQDCATVSVSLDGRAGVATRDLWLRDEGRYDGDWARGERRVRVGFGDPESGSTLLALCRVAVASDAEVDRLLAGSDDAEQCAATIAPAPVSWRNERAAMERLDAVATEALRGRENLDAERGGGNVNARNAAIAADVETEILVHWQTLARRASYVLDFASDADDAPSAFDVGLYYPDFLRQLLDSPECFPEYAPPTAAPVA